MSETGTIPSDSSRAVTRRIRLHKAARPLDEASGNSFQASNLQLGKHVEEIVAGIADLPIPRSPALEDAQTVEMRRLRQTQRSMAQAEGNEINSLFDMSKPHPLDDAPPSTPWTGEMRPTPRKAVLSPYQLEMINYQRMLMRKNIWYYRDRMNIPRGPCPLHVVKEAWVSGIVDENTMFWGHGLYDWLPAKNIKLLLPMVRTPEVRFATWVKRTFSLKPSLNRIREQRKEYRDPQALNQQVDLMR